MVLEAAWEVVMEEVLLPHLPKHLLLQPHLPLYRRHPQLLLLQWHLLLLELLPVEVCPQCLECLISQPDL